jgi:hypothetical protein
MNRLKQKIEKRINTSPRRSFSLYNNILAGIITGSALGLVFPLFKKYGDTNFIYNWILNIGLILIFLIIFYKLGKFALNLVTKDNSEYKNYDSNFTAGLIASIYVIFMLSSTLLYRLLLIPLSVIGLIIILYFIAKRRKNG